MSTKISNKLKNLRTLLMVGKCQCPKDCFECCTSIKFTIEEKKLMDKCLKKKGYKNHPRGKGEGFCEYLDENGKCVVYEERPIVCRALGVVDHAFLRCPLTKPIRTLPHYPELSLYGMGNREMTRNNCIVGNIEDGIKRGDPKVLSNLAQMIVQAKRDGSITLEESGHWLDMIDKKIQEKGGTLEDLF